MFLLDVGKPIGEPLSATAFSSAVTPLYLNITSPLGHATSVPHESKRDVPFVLVTNTESWNRVLRPQTGLFA